MAVVMDAIFASKVTRQ